MTAILIIADDAQLRRGLRAAFRAQGYRVWAASSGAAGLLAFFSHSPQAVLLDPRLPDVDGIDVLAKIREHSNVPVVIISSAGSERDKVTAFDRGANDYITKPFRLAELSARLRAALRTLKARQTPEDD